MALEPPEGWIKIGHVLGVYGVRGWIKVYSQTDPMDNIFRYSPWQMSTRDGWKEVKVLQGRRQGKGIVAQLQDLDDRTAAERLVGAELIVPVASLPKLKDGEYYWSQLVGLKVITTEGVELGVVERLMETGSNDVIIVAGERERLLPYLMGQTVVSIDLDAGQMRVDWDPEF